MFNYKKPSPSQGKRVCNNVQKEVYFGMCCFPVWGMCRQKRTLIFEITVLLFLKSKTVFFPRAIFYNINRQSYHTMQNSPDYGRSHGAIFFSFTGCFHEICCCYNWWLNDFHIETLRQSFVEMYIRDSNEVNKPFILLQQIAIA